MAVSKLDNGFHKLLDKLGAALSAACAVHCFLAPLLITVAPLLGIGFLFQESTENIIILTSLGLASLSIIWGFRKKHRQLLPLYILCAGIAFIGLSRFETVSSIVSEPLLMGLGGLSLAISHLINMRLCNDCSDCSDH